MSISAMEPDLLKGMDPGLRERVLGLGEMRKLDEGEIIFRLGEETAGVFVILTGRVNLTLPISLDGRQENILVEERSAGQLLGWSGMVPPHRFTLQAKAQVATELLFLPRPELEGLFAELPEAAAGVYGNLARIIGQRLQVFQAMWVRSVQRGMAHGRG